jgi:DNA invertase Pin-like site-specific DNA recombinase
MEIPPDEPASNGKVSPRSGAGAKRVALYLRVSTSDGRQTEENQRKELRAFCEREGYDVAGEYVDHESGRKGRKTRQAFNAMFEAAERREIDLVVFWSLDRFSLEGIWKTIHYLPDSVRTPSHI